ncbi:MAG: GNAT family acetyltransferase [Pseudomonadota bacterium]
MKHSDITIRPFDEADEAAVIALWNKVFDYSAPHNDPAASIRRKLDVHRELFLVAVMDGSVIGTVMGGYDGHRGWIHSMATDPESQKKGIGTLLMQHVEQAIKARGCVKINLQVREDNAEVIAFYKSLGYDTEPRVSMGKRLM